MPTPLPDADGSPARHSETRARNVRIAYTARQHRFDPTIPVPFICECSDDRCDELIRLTLSEYTDARNASDFLVAPGHQVENADIVRLKDGVWLYRVR